MFEFFTYLTSLDFGGVMSCRVLWNVIFCLSLMIYLCHAFFLLFQFLLLDFATVKLIKLEGQGKLSKLRVYNVQLFHWLVDFIGLGSLCVMEGAFLPLVNVILMLISFIIGVNGMVCFVHKSTTTWWFYMFTWTILFEWNIIVWDS